MSDVSISTAPRPGRSSTAPTAPARRRGTLSWLRRLHRWLGLALMLPMLLQGVTGTVLVASALLAPDRPRGAMPSDTAMPLPAESIVAAARAAAPSGEALLRYAPARQAGDSVEVGFGRAGSRNPDTRVLVDPVTGEVLARRHASALLALVRGWHTALLLPMPLGRTLIGWVGIGLLLLALLGIPLWWPRPAGRRLASLGRGAVVSPRARGQRLWRELHVALGTWTGLMILLMSSTGIVMSFPQTTRALLGLPTAMRPDGGGDRRPGREHGPGGGPEHRPDGWGAATTPADDSRLTQGLDAAIASLRRAVPGAGGIDIAVSPAPAPFNVRYTLPGGGGQNIRIDRDGTLHGAGNGARHDWREGISSWSHMLHEAKPPFAPWAVTAWKLVVGLAGLSLTLFSVSGFLVWLLRRRRRKANRAALPGGPG